MVLLSNARSGMTNHSFGLPAKASATCGGLETGALHRIVGLEEGS
jgi:hypothetical protein